MNRSVSTIVSRRPVCVRPEARVRDALACARERGVEHLLVAETDDLVGIVCSRDLEAAGSNETVASCMKAPALTIDAGASIDDAAELMRVERVGSLLVTAGKLLLGIVTRRDLERAGVPEDAMGAACAARGAHHHIPRMTADRYLEPREHAWLIAGPEAHRAKLAFEKYFLATRGRGIV